MLLEMEITEILSGFERLTKPFPYEAVEAAADNREAITPELLRIVEDAIERAEERGKDHDYMAHIFAMFLLGEFRETRAYPLVIRMASLPAGLLDELCASFVTEDLHRVLASVCGGYLAPIQALIENEDACEFARAAGLAALVTLVAAGEKPRDEVMSYFADLFRGKLERKPSYAWSALVGYASDLHPEEVFSDIRQAYEEGLVDSYAVGFDEVEEDLAKGREAMMRRLAASHRHRLLRSAVSEMEHWRCFQERDEKARTPFERAAWATVNTPYRREAPKAGRNDRCPCGSGKKFKKCCGREAGARAAWRPPPKKGRTAPRRSR